MIWVLWTVVAADAKPTGDLVARWGARTVRVEQTRQDPENHPWGSDWLVAVGEQWSAVVTCTPGERGSERCTIDQVQWSAQPVSTMELKTYTLPSPGTVELVWHPSGRLISWDLVGDREAFRSSATSAMWQALYRDSTRVLKPHVADEIGQSIEQDLVDTVVAGLEWELPKTGLPEGEWKPRYTPRVARLSPSSQSSPDLRMSVTGTDDQSYQLQVNGTVVEPYLVNDSVTTQVAGTATFDRQAGTIVAARIETKATSSKAGILVGYRQRIVQVTPIGP